MLSNSEIQAVHSIISILSKSKSEHTTLFYINYRKYFTILSVPFQRFDKQDDPSIVPTFVRVNTKQALEYLKSKYNFYSKEERTAILQEESKNYQTETRT